MLPLPAGTGARSASGSESELLLLVSLSLELLPLVSLLLRDDVEEEDELLLLLLPLLVLELLLSESLLLAELRELLRAAPRPRLSAVHACLAGKRVSPGAPAVPAGTGAETLAAWSSLAAGLPVALRAGAALLVSETVLGALCTPLPRRLGPDAGRGCRAGTLPASASAT